MTWKRGESGNPGGRPVSTHTAELRALLRRAAPAVAVRVLKAALEDGDMAAARLILERVMPVARSAPVDVDLSGGSFRERMTAVLEGMTAQRLTLEEGTRLLDALAKAAATEELALLEERISAIETRQASRSGAPRVVVLDRRKPAEQEDDDGNED